MEKQQKGFYNVGGVFHGNHPFRCGCKKSSNDFQEFEPPQVELKCGSLQRCMDVLMLGENSAENARIQEFAKVHYVILVRIYHPVELWPNLIRPNALL